MDGDRQQQPNESGHPGRSEHPGSQVGQLGGEAPPELEVRVLGPVEAVGAAGPFLRAGALDLVVYLAMHPRGATTERWSTALWPERLPAGPTLHSTVSSARRSLGRSTAGTDHLPRQRGPLRLAPTAGSDWARFRRLADGGDPGGWRAGLSLVRGRPFEDLRCADWTVLEGHAAAIEDGVVRLAGRLAEHELRRGDGAAAEQVVRLGLRASPYDERLYR
ncbi:MAG TPA: bacterial transcriptional activator domain-containing protein, partial [Acidimicrobiales bacterium]|nr:bacterial transcriptional activator domain-containing protein [Acidimicrobiales bacterium]